MRKSIPILRSTVLPGILLLMSLESPAQDGEGAKREWSVKLGVGAEYDTNVTVDEVDLSSGQSDHATIVDFGVGMKQALGERTTFALNYDLSQSNYDEFSQVDRLTQIIGADINAVVGDATAGFSAYFIDSQLDGDGFLEYLRLSPSVSGFLSRRWFARAAYVHSKRRIDQREERNADTNTGEVDLYYFHRGLRSYANIGFRYRREDAIASELDFEANALKLRYIRRLDVFGKRLKSEVAVRYEVRDYLSAEPTIEEARNDDRLRVKVDLELPINERLSWQIYYSYGDYESNLPRADFTQTIVGTKLQIRW